MKTKRINEGNKLGAGTALATPLDALVMCELHEEHNDD